MDIFGRRSPIPRQELIKERPINYSARDETTHSFITNLGVGCVRGVWGIRKFKIGLAMDADAGGSVARHVVAIAHP